MRQRRQLTPGQRVSLASSRRSSEEVVPWFAIEHDGQQLFGGIMWSGSSAVNIENVAGRLRLSAAHILILRVLEPAVTPAWLRR